MTLLADDSLEKALWALLEEVKDPEMPPVSLVEMGMIHQVSIADGIVAVEVLPTFVGCPALKLMKKSISEKLSELEQVREIRVNFVFDPPWTSDRISDAGREKLRSFGIAPPPKSHKPGEMWEVNCPYCGSPYTKMENLFGPAACRSILYCPKCKNPFEAFKPIAVSGSN
ncbi:1,2-phenylacetyl-CoA epoxidase subunit PaaD [Ferviditalea candida]|uniref:1,2-phenylacetyl-CoA epoxidase subunit PaaD n=1 Tax=Ferviditalea candida TaxID=3108399 RepID=A0ABU5ZK63_9BACL|nr:1,2-phenylacetyl-CoA epoxidase subunit PaaD [Paenibacillaceae bacterium T2]